MSSEGCIKVSVDAIIYDPSYRVVLVKRAYDPFKDHWCLPGGLVKEEERLHEAVSREVREETGLEISFSKDDYFTYFDSPTRDPRFRNITHVFVKQVEEFNFGDYDKREVSRVAAFSLNDVENVMLGFDHKNILREWMNKYL